MNVYRKYYNDNKQNIDGIFEVIRHTKSTINNIINNISVKDGEITYSLLLKNEIIDILDDNGQKVDSLYELEKNGRIYYLSKKLIKDFFEGYLSVVTMKNEDGYLLKVRGNLNDLTDLKNDLEEDIYYNNNKEKYSIEETEIIRFTEDERNEYLVFTYPFMSNGQIYYYKYDKLVNRFYMFEVPKTDFAHRNTYRINNIEILNLFSYARFNNSSKKVLKK